MTVAQRVAICRLIEQILERPEYCREIGIEAVVRIKPQGISERSE